MKTSYAMLSSGMLVKRGMRIGKWGLENGDWRMGNGEWGMGNGNGEGEWEIKNGKLKKISKYWKKYEIVML